MTKPQHTNNLADLSNKPSWLPSVYPEWRFVYGSGLEDLMGILRVGTSFHM